MPHVPYPPHALTEIVGRGYILPQSVLEAPQTASRQTLILGHGRWHGLVSVCGQEREHEVEIRNWLARMSQGDSYTDVPLGSKRLLPDAGRVVVQTPQPAGARVLVTGGAVNSAVDFIGMWLHDGKRSRTVVAAAQPASPAWDIALWPETPPLEAGTQLREQTRIQAYQRLEQDDQQAAPIAEFGRDWMEAVNILWIERVTP